MEKVDRLARASRRYTRTRTAGTGRRVNARVLPRKTGVHGESMSFHFTCRRSMLGPATFHDFISFYPLFAPRTPRRAAPRAIRKYFFFYRAASNSSGYVHTVRTLRAGFSRFNEDSLGLLKVTLQMTFSSGMTNRVNLLIVRK